MRYLLFVIWKQVQHDRNCRCPRNRDPLSLEGKRNHAPSIPLNPMQTGSQEA